MRTPHAPLSSLSYFQFVQNLVWLPSLFLPNFPAQEICNFPQKAVVRDPAQHIGIRRAPSIRRLLNSIHSSAHVQAFFAQTKLQIAHLSSLGGEGLRMIWALYTIWIFIERVSQVHLPPPHPPRLVLNGRSWVQGTSIRVLSSQKPFTRLPCTLTQNSNSWRKGHFCWM